MNDWNPDDPVHRRVLLAMGLLTAVLWTVLIVGEVMFR